MKFVATFILLSVGGIIDAGYMFLSYRKGSPLICPTDHDCTVVTKSEWSQTLGIRNELLGTVFYFILFAGMLGSLFAPQIAKDIYFGLLLMTSGGLAFSVFLTGVQIFAIHDYCFYCLVSASLSLLLFLNSLALYFHY